MDFTQSNALLSTDLEAIIAAASDPAAELERLAGSLEGEIATFRQWLADSLQRQEDLPRLIEEGGKLAFDHHKAARDGQRVEVGAPDLHGVV